MDPWERSIPAHKIARVCPLAKKKTTEDWRKTFKMLLIVRKAGERTVKTPHIRRKATNRSKLSQWNPPS
jgi:hypothetical protein